MATAEIKQVHDMLKQAVIADFADLEARVMQHLLYEGVRVMGVSHDNPDGPPSVCIMGRHWVHPIRGVCQTTHDGNYGPHQLDA